MDYNLSDIKYSFNNKNFDSKRILSTKTKFLDSFIYECRNLTEWIRYKDCKFRYKEVLYFLEIPLGGDDIDLKYFSKNVSEKFNGSFYGLLKKIEIYFNQENDDLNWKRKEEFSKWERECSNPA